MPTTARTGIRAAAASTVVLAACFAAGTARAGGVPDPVPSASHTVEWSGAPAAPAPASAAAAIGPAAAGAAAGAALPPRPGPALARRDPINAGPLQGPLLSGGAPAAPRCGCPPVRHVVHHRRVARAVPAPVTVATLPRPVYAYPPVVYRPVVPVYAYRPIYPTYPYVYRPYGYRPFFFRRGFPGY